MVVVYHALDLWAERTIQSSADAIWPNGSAGVDIFFVISGFVMVISAQRIAGRDSAWRVFLRHRLQRIVPLYWIATTAKVALVLALPAVASHTQLSVPYVLGSYLFLPVQNWRGDFVPVLPVGWTLTYEMLFYLLVVLALALRKPILWIALPGLVLFAALGAYDPKGFASTVVLEFLYGVGLGLTVQRCARLPAPVAAILLATGFVALLLMPGSTLLQPIYWGLPAFAIVLGAIVLEPVLAPVLPLWLLAAGDASYATYLTHGFVVTVVARIVIAMPLTSGLSLTVIIAASLVLSAAAGHFVYTWLERPLLRRLRQNRKHVSALPAE